jgi:hypothetical protein
VDAPEHTPYDPAQAVMSGALDRGEPIEIDDHPALSTGMAMGEEDPLVTTQTQLSIWLDEEYWATQKTIGVRIRLVSDQTLNFTTYWPHTKEVRRVEPGPSVNSMEDEDYSDLAGIRRQQNSLQRVCEFFGRR